MSDGSAAEHSGLTPLPVREIRVISCLASPTRGTMSGHGKENAVRSVGTTNTHRLRSL
jgi:hypothetical protein